MRPDPAGPDPRPVVPRPAATVVLLRGGGASPMEVLLLRRHAKAGFAASTWVFPGGMVDAADATLPPDRWSGIEPDALAGRFGMPPDRVLALHVAAVRETFEEAGVLLAHHGDGSPPSTPPDALAALRHDLNDRATSTDLAGFLSAHDLVLDLGAVRYWSRWITPAPEPRRFDTAFFVAAVPPGATATADEGETTHARWVAPRAALADPDVAMIFPTERTLERLDALGDPAAVLADAAGTDVVEPTRPHVLLGADGRPEAIVLPGDPRYPAEPLP